MTPCAFWAPDRAAGDLDHLGLAGLGGERAELGRGAPRSGRANQRNGWWSEEPVGSCRALRPKDRPRSACRPTSTPCWRYRLGVAAGMAQSFRPTGGNLRDVGCFGWNVTFARTSSELRKRDCRNSAVTTSATCPAAMFDDRNERLKDEAEGHRPAGAVDQVLSDALANLRRETVSSQATSDKGDHQRDDHLRQQNSRLRWRPGHCLRLLFQRDASKRGGVWGAMRREVPRRAGSGRSSARLAFTRPGQLARCWSFAIKDRRSSGRVRSER